MKSEMPGWFIWYFLFFGRSFAELLNLFSGQFSTKFSEDLSRGNPLNLTKSLDPPLITHFQCSGVGIYTVFDEESASDVKNLEILHSDLETEENLDISKKTPGNPL